jgi:dynein heavy chain
MYQYSLDFFKGLFVTAIGQSEKSDELDERLGFLNKEFLESLYRNICRSLFEKDKMMDMEGELDKASLMFFLTGGVSLGEELPENPCNNWLSEKLWGEINRLGKL